MNHKNLLIALISTVLLGCTNTLNENSSKVDLYYYNIEKDKEIADYIPCSPDAVLPIPREMTSSDNIIEDTINLLLQGKIASIEAKQGFQTEFPNPDFQLLETNIDNDILTLTFQDSTGFTTGGSCRVGLLAAQIEKTALQFPEVGEVRFLPESLFQP